jgi:hypothetical protein
MAFFNSLKKLVLKVSDPQYKSLNRLSKEMNAALVHAACFLYKIIEFMFDMVGEMFVEKRFEHVM